MLSKDEVKHIAHLARLGLTEAELEKYAEQISAILDYVSQLKEVDTTGVEATAQVTGLENVMRPDVIENCDSKTMKKLIELAPESEDNLVKTKSVFE
ncbi:MAG: asparaginyl/glutamyl-tRNA amidotransferase subunit C [Candidatus Buchananbacteria bacterium RIFCSPHIGHO2_01_FULL_39_14]|uniref:Aspartyl/glutamyl-tRNA(Asn/Gln) amidotransferase subunit C n=2 Tax=Candidatus Buchananiibacteriota TaxID=1817903 RepID=A0A1G1YW33_9BACT|nr:MAG: asparaginyl/glutamyl-tRNA amidotransferase subunit C [Candidatus Buchananbacteria bacterium RIFCSPHIGHO2_01_FULL_39_14]OGY49014.1 MAG: asparaginyl/glutamyl-tRNA amidotransferase subunit C [Candidatus Buchananbacteria bacterium RIFCSPHIGHO2_02_FULL_39_17]OGY55976.1 MAG: asparaginyl/glutamyl-tRNA amidotransferase subunit C [Candidatus Buchananbacteria bacterium RIFCSPLOWO2_01_FULL_40_23b]